MRTNLLDQTWKEVWYVNLNKDIFWLELNEWLIHRALAYVLSSSRKNIAHTKTRWERAWSTRKIYKQKWTGRARMWANRSPIRKKGGIVFGPRNSTNFSISMNKKERRKALFCVLSSKLKNKDLIIVDNIKLKEIKTKEMVNIFSKLPTWNTSLLAISEKDYILQKSVSNIPYAKTILINYLNVKDLLKYKTIILLKWTLENLNNLVK